VTIGGGPRIGFASQMWRADAGEDGCNHMLAESEHPLEHANEALAAVRNGQLDGAAVLDVSAR
jgi:hypothetical protein